MTGLVKNMNLSLDKFRFLWKNESQTTEKERNPLGAVGGLRKNALPCNHTGPASAFSCVSYDTDQRTTCV